jgi:iron(III) transport system substrate-binding protein
MVSLALFMAACSPDEPTSTQSEPQTTGTEAPVMETPEASAPLRAGSNGTLRIYSARHYESDKVMYDTFERESGVRVLYREAGANQLLETMKAEGANSPADLIIASDAGALWRFQDAGLTQPLPEGDFNDDIPDRLIEPERHYVGLARRIRGVAYDPERISSDQVDQWADLTDPTLEGEICARSSTNIYNLSLMGEMIETWGAEEAQAWANGVVSNMARPPQGGDTDQVEAVAAGLCSVAITNHYYWVRMLESGSSSTREAANRTELIFPSFGNDEGIHVNITGVAMTASAANPEAAQDFIAFLMTPEGQSLLVSQTREIPASPAAERPEGLDAIPQFEDSSTPLNVYGERQAEAQRIFDAAGWN